MKHETDSTSRRMLRLARRSQASTSVSLSNRSPTSENSGDVVLPPAAATDRPTLRALPGRPAGNAPASAGSAA